MLRQVVELTATLFEAGGTIAMAGGALMALARVIGDRGAGGSAMYSGFRVRLGRAIILGLELLVAADILRTISTAPTLRGVVVLGLIVVIRTFLSFSLEVELENRWPWQQKQKQQSEPPPPAR
jgi:uncharacterized membrane protein